MKDPLQAEPTPYEVLRLERGASAAEVNRAFRTGVAERWAAVPKLTEARKALQDPSSRALVDLFVYDRAALGRLSPCPLEDPESLALSRRGETAAAWQRLLRQSFPDLRTAHCLAVLWYWWANHVEEKAGGEPEDGAPSREAMWRQVIAYWTLLSSSEEFWDGSFGIPADLGPTLRPAVHERLGQRFDALAARARAQSATGPLERYQALRLALSTERRAAKEVARVGIRAKGGKICCGPLMLEQVGLLPRVRHELDQLLKRHPTHERLLALQGMLSPYSSIAVLLQEHKPQRALEVLDGLPAEEGRLEEVRALRARALAALGEEQWSVERYEEALASWKAAFALGTLGEFEGSARASLIHAVKERAGALRARELDEAIALLEEGLKVVDDPDLRRTLGEDYRTRAVTRYNAAQPTQGSSVTAEMFKEWEAARRDINRAAKLGSEKAKEEAKTIRAAIKREKELIEIPPRAQKPFREGEAAGARQEWDVAVLKLREALKAAGRDSPAVISRTLAVCLFNRAMEKRNSAVEMLNETAQRQNAEVQRILSSIRHMDPLVNPAIRAQLLSSGALSPTCDRCGTGSAGSWFNLNLPALGQPALVCGTCSAAIQRELDAVPTPKSNTEAVALLWEAREDLSAAELEDPGNKAVRRSLDEVKKLLTDVGVSKKPSRPRSGTRIPPRTKRAPRKPRKSKGAQTKGRRVRSALAEAAAFVAAVVYAGVGLLVIGYLASQCAP